MSMAGSPREYQAFMSYSHAADGRLAPALQRGLQRIGKPWYGRHVIRVFRDETSLSASPQLWAEIERNLARAAFFILMASPKAAASPWVHKEVQWWLANRSADRFLIVVTQGEIVWNSRADDFDWDRTTCLPPDLRGRFRGEPLYVDLRWASGTPELSLRHAKFRDVVLTLAAPLYGKPKDELDSEEIRQHRRFRIAAFGAVASLNVLLFVSVFATWSARQESARADANWREAESRKLANAAINTLQSEKNLDDAVKMAVMAWELAPTVEAEAALEKLAGLSSDMARVLGQHTGGMAAHAFSPDSSQLATIGRDGSIQLWDTRTWTLAGPILAGGVQNAAGLTFNDGGTHLLAWAENGEMELWELAGRIPRAIQGFKSPGTRLASVSLSPDGRSIAVGANNSQLAVWDAKLDAVRQKPVGSVNSVSVRALRFAPDGRLFAALFEYQGMRIGTWDASGGKPRLGPNVDIGHALSYTDYANFNQKGTRLAVAGEGAVGIWDVGPDLTLHALPLVKVEGGASRADLDADGKTLFAQRPAFPQGRWEIWFLSGAPAFKGGGPLNGRAAWSPDGHWRAELVRGGWHADDIRGERVLVWDMSATGGSAPTRAFSTECRFRNDESGCVRRLCNMIAPSLNEEHLKKLFGIESYVVLYDKYKTVTGAALCGLR